MKGQPHYKKKGEWYPEDCNMDGELFEELVKRDVIPAIQTKMPWAKEVAVQMDGAKPHTKAGVLTRLNALGAKKAVKVKFVVQPANSPDFNVLDLSLFHSWGKRAAAVEGDGQGDAGAERAHVVQGVPAVQARARVPEQGPGPSGVHQGQGGNHFDVPHTSAADRAKLPGFQAIAEDWFPS